MREGHKRASKGDEASGVRLIFHDQMLCYPSYDGDIRVLVLVCLVDELLPRAELIDAAINSLCENHFDWFDQVAGSLAL